VVVDAAALGTRMLAGAGNLKDGHALVNRSKIGFVYMKHLTNFLQALLW
jgi:hypothetical protein